MKTWSIVVLRLALAVVFLAPALAACGSGEASLNPKTMPFYMDVVPVHMGDTIAGQSCVFMVTITDDTTSHVVGDPVSISAGTQGASATVGPGAISAGYVAEVVVVPDKESIGKTVTVSITGQRGDITRTETATLNVGEDPEDLLAKTVFATALRDMFIAYLEKEQPDLKITSQTEWIGAIIYPHGPADIGYYLFFSEEWEMGVRWHNTTGDDDWARIYLRQRTVDLTPSKAFEISSMQANDEPHPIPPPKQVWR